MITDYYHHKWLFGSKLTIVVKIFESYFQNYPFFFVNKVVTNFLYIKKKQRLNG